MGSQQFPPKPTHFGGPADCPAQAQDLPFSKAPGKNSSNEYLRPKKASKVLRPEAGWASSLGRFNWLEPLKYADAGIKV